VSGLVLGQSGGVGAVWRWWVKEKDEEVKAEAYRRFWVLNDS